MKNQAGFTLIEMLIVVILIGILAMVIIPQIGVSTKEAKENTLKADLSAIRSAVELYYHQHNEIYPGANDSTTGLAVANEAAAATSFVAQLTQYTDENGETQVSKDATFKFGPYIKGNTLPTNPCNDMNTVLC
ncbi:MAG: type II secretion system protein, partial [Deltaproteobacteria bacterium]|nr:type II secretion system protein [Deltaproteobacteria bacterium]